MKTHSNKEIPVFQNLGTNRWYYHFNHGILIDEEGVSYTSNTVVMAGDPVKTKVEHALSSPLTDKGEPDDVYQLPDTLDEDVSLVVSYSDDVYKSVTRQDVEGLQWIGNEVVVTGQNRSYNGIIYECIQGHITQIGWEPDLTPALWKVAPTDEVSEWVQPSGSSDAYNIGDRVIFESKTYESVIDANVYSPSAYPEGWIEV